MFISLTQELIILAIGIKVNNFFKILGIFATKKDQMVKCGCLATSYSSGT